jgi:type IV pilus assembly protein PilC
VSWTSSAAFYEQMHRLLAAGMTAAQAVASAAPGCGRPYSDWADDLRRACDGGTALSQALAAAGEHPLAVALIRAGEGNGKVPMMCSRLTAWFDHLRRVRGMVIARSLYPVLLIHLALVVPAIPAVVAGDPAWWLLAGPAGLWLALATLAATWFGLRRLGLTEQIWDLAPLRALVLPLVAGNTCLVMQGTTAAGMFHDQGLDLAADACGVESWRQRLRASGQRLRRGDDNRLADALAGIGFTRPVVQLLATGEDSGSLEEALGRCATLERERFETRLLWTARVVMGAVYALAMLLVALVVIRFWMGYLSAIEQATAW